MELVLECSVEMFEGEDISSYFIEAVENHLPLNIKQKISSPAIRRQMLQKYGSRSFLLPDQLKFPICNPDTGKIDCKLLYAAYLRANQFKGSKPGYRELALKAKSIFRDNGCEHKIGVHLEGSDEILPIEQFLDLVL